MKEDEKFVRVELLRKAWDTFNANLAFILAEGKEITQEQSDSIGKEWKKFEKNTFDNAIQIGGTK